jgi:hypothetical protein
MIFPWLEAAISVAYLVLTCLICRWFLWPPNRD